MAPISDRFIAFGWAAALAAVSIWAGWAVASRYLLLHGTLDIPSMVALRFLFAAVVMLPVVLRGLPLGRLGLWRSLAIALGSGAVFSLLNTGGLYYAPAAHASALTAPLGGVLTGLAAHFLLGERLSRRSAAGFAVIAAGAIGVVLASVLSTGGQARMLIGHLHFLGAAMCWAGYVVVARRSGLNPLQLTALSVIVSALFFSVPYLVFAGEAIRAASWQEIAVQGTVHGLLAAALSVMLFNTAIVRLGAARAGAATALAPVLGAVLALIVLREVPGPVEWLGYAAVALGVWLAASRGSPARGAVAPPPPSR